jgi:enoyl-CoA hydratase/carnithine racemase
VHPRARARRRGAHAASRRRGDARAALVCDKDPARLLSITFDNPPVHLVDPEMSLELQALVEQLEHDAQAAVLVFDSAIDGRFLGPYDMSRAAEAPSAPRPTGMPPGFDLTVRRSRLPMLSIAVIRGASRGVGQELALACDLRFASLERTTIDQPEVSHRVVPGGGALARLPLLVGRGRALELIVGAVVLDGPRPSATASSTAVPDDELDAFVERLATDVASYDRQTLADAKALVDRATSPEHTDLVIAYDFFRSVARASSRSGGAGFVEVGGFGVGDDEAGELDA